MIKKNTKIDLNFDSNDYNRQTNEDKNMLPKAQDKIVD
jgi:hypothetical protein